MFQFCLLKNTSSDSKLFPNKQIIWDQMKEKCNDFDLMTM